MADRDVKVFRLMPATTTGELSLDQWLLTWGKLSLGVNSIIQGVNLFKHKLQQM